MSVPTTKTIHFAHVAQSLVRRQKFQPKAMHSDTYPNKSEFWSLLFPIMEGRLGLFHCIPRIRRTLQKNHIDCLEPITVLTSWRGVESSLRRLWSRYCCFEEGIFGKEDSQWWRHCRSQRETTFQTKEWEGRPQNHMTFQHDGAADWWLVCSMQSDRVRVSRSVQEQLDPKTHMALFKAETKNCSGWMQKEGRMLVCSLANARHVLDSSGKTKFTTSAATSSFAQSGIKTGIIPQQPIALCKLWCEKLPLWQIESLWCSNWRFNLGMRHKFQLTRQNTQREAASEKNNDSMGRCCSPLQSLRTSTHQQHCKTSSSKPNVIWKCRNFATGWWWAIRFGAHCPI